MKARDTVLQEETRCIKQEQSICPLVIIEHTGAAAKLFNACQSKPQRLSGLPQQSRKHVIGVARYDEQFKMSRKVLWGTYVLCCLQSPFTICKEKTFLMGSTLLRAI